MKRLAWLALCDWFRWHYVEAPWWSLLLEGYIFGFVGGMLTAVALFGIALTVIGR